MSESTLTLVPTPETWDREAPTVDTSQTPWSIRSALNTPASWRPSRTVALVHPPDPPPRAPDEGPLPLEVRGLLDQVAETDHRLPEAVVDPVVAPVEDPFFQQHQADAPAVFSAQGLLRFHRLSSSVASLEPRAVGARQPPAARAVAGRSLALPPGRPEPGTGARLPRPRNTWESLDVPDLPGVARGLRRALRR